MWEHSRIGHGFLLERSIQFFPPHSLLRHCQLSSRNRIKSVGGLQQNFIPTFFNSKRDAFDLRNKIQNSTSSADVPSYLILLTLDALRKVHWASARNIVRPGQRTVVLWQQHLNNTIIQLHSLL